MNTDLLYEIGHKDPTNDIGMLNKVYKAAR